VIIDESLISLDDFDLALELVGAASR